MPVTQSFWFRLPGADQPSHFSCSAPTSERANALARSAWDARQAGGCEMLSARP